jgi:hypothetical protein
MTKKSLMFLDFLKHDFRVYVFLVILSDLRVVGFFQLSAMAFWLLSWIDSCITYLLSFFYLLAVSYGLFK